MSASSRPWRQRGGCLPSWSQLIEAFPDHVSEVMRQSKHVMLQTLARHGGVLHVEIDYRTCGVSQLDFWQEAAMYFALAHPNPRATVKITNCVIEALDLAGLDTILATP